MITVSTKKLINKALNESISRYESAIEHCKKRTQNKTMDLHISKLEKKVHDLRNAIEEIA